MRLVRFVLRFILLAAPAVACADELAVLLRLVAPDALEVTYTLPPACQHVAFLKDGAGAKIIRGAWQPQDACGTAGGDLLIRTNPGCGALRFRVPVSTDKVSGYPAAFPLGEAIYAHMSNYAVSTQCGPVQYRVASSGSIATAGQRFEKDAASDFDAPALLFAKTIAAGAGLDYFDPQLSAAAVAQIRTVADGTASFLQAAMPGAVFKRPILAGSVASQPGGPNIGGSAGDVLLLTLFNWPAAPGLAQQRLMNKLVAHEMSHRFQMRDAVDEYRDARLIHEGGAEFLRWAVSLQQGWLTPAQAAGELDEALAACVLAVGERSWRAVPAREIAVNHLEYSCGLPAYVYALAARQGAGSPYARIDAFYRQLRGGAKPDFAEALECGAAPCTPRVLPTILNGDRVLRAQWAAALEASALARPRAPNQSQTDAMMLAAVTELVVDDCGGKRSMTPTANSILVDTMTACRTVRADLEVVGVEGLPLFGGMAALPAMLAACADHHTVALGLKTGASLAMPCRAPYRALSAFYAADIDTLIERLGIQR